MQVNSFYFFKKLLHIIFSCILGIISHMPCTRHLLHLATIYTRLCTAILRKSNCLPSWCLRRVALLWVQMIPAIILLWFIRWYCISRATGMFSPPVWTIDWTWPHCSPLPAVRGHEQSYNFDSAYAGRSPLVPRPYLFGFYHTCFFLSVYLSIFDSNSQLMQ